MFLYKCLNVLMEEELRIWTGMLFQTSLPLLEKVFNRIFVFALLVVEMMSPRVDDRREYLCEGTFTRRSEMYDGAWLLIALYTKTPVWYLYLLLKVSHLRVLKSGREGVRFGFIKTNLAVLFWIAYSLFKLDFVPLAHTTQQ